MTKIQELEKEAFRPIEELIEIAEIRAWLQHEGVSASSYYSSLSNEIIFLDRIIRVKYSKGITDESIVIKREQLWKKASLVLELL